MRGSGNEDFAAKIWGISGHEYMQAADPWPLNPKGEPLLSVKIEDKYALASAEKVAAVAGIGFAEWGPGDMGLSLGFLENHDPPYPPAMAAARSRVMAALKAHQRRAHQQGRKLTNRQMPYYMAIKRSVG